MNYSNFNRGFYNFFKAKNPNNFYNSKFSSFFTSNKFCKANLGANMKINFSNSIFMNKVIVLKQSQGFCSVLGMKNVFNALNSACEGTSKDSTIMKAEIVEGISSYGNVIFFSDQCQWTSSCVSLASGPQTPI